MQRVAHGLQNARPIGRKFRQRRDFGHQCSAVTCRQRRQQRTDAGLVDRAQHGGHRSIGELTAGVRDRLVQQRQAVTQAAIGRAADLAHRTGLDRNPFGVQDLLHLPADLVFIQALEIELQAPRQHGHRQFLRVGCRQQEFHVPRGLFQRLQQGVERGLREHVHFVDQVHLHPAARGHVLGVVDQVTDIVHAGVGGGVDLQQVDEPAGVDVQARVALPAGIGGRALLAIERFGEDPRDRGLAHPAGAGKQEGMMDPAAVERVGQRPHHVLLPHQFGEALGPPLAGENEIGHRLPWTSPAGSVGPWIRRTPTQHPHCAMPPPRPTPAASRSDCVGANIRLVRARAQR